MRMRSGRILTEMVNPKNTSRARNDAPDPEPPIMSMVGTAKTSNPLGVLVPFLLKY